MLLSEMIRSCARSYGEKPAYIDGNRTRTWGEIDARSDRIAAVLQAHGIKRNDVAVVLSQDRLEVIEHWFACLKIGAIRVGANYRYSPAEVAHVIKDSGAKCVLVESACMHLLSDSENFFKQNNTLVIGFGGAHRRVVDFEEAIANSKPLASVLLDPCAPVAIAYTAGSTGMPKGVVWTNLGMREGMKWLVLNAGLTPEDRWFNPLPVAAGPLLFSTMNMVNGMTTVLPDGRFEPKKFANTLSELKITATQLVPTMLQDVIVELTARPKDTSSLRLLCYGSMPATPALIRAAKDIFKCQIQQWYGSTEMTGIVSILRDADHMLGLEKNSELLMSCGRPMPHAEIQIRSDDGAVLAPGEIGNVWVKSETLFAGYHARPEETQASLVEGWFRPGDIGKISKDGYLFLLDRKHFMIISGGYNVYPSVIEATLAEIAGVLEVAVVGAPHPRWGEAVAATIAIKQGATVTEAQVHEFARLRLAKWEQPKHVEFVPSLPRGATGKIDRRSIRDTYRAHPESLSWNT
jgi:acyl-CoA synthetase (AMP-forming)/AMP-acid ligase II